MHIREIYLLLIIIFPFVCLLVLFTRAYRRFLRTYRRIINPPFPLATDSEAVHQLHERPDLFFQHVFTLPAVWWKILFERQSHPELRWAARKARIYLFLFFGLALPLPFVIAFLGSLILGT